MRKLKDQLKETRARTEALHKKYGDDPSHQDITQSRIEEDRYQQEIE